MRKFNLRGTVVERMKGIQREEPKPADAGTTKNADMTVMDAAFTEEQGAFSYSWRTDVGKLRKNNQDAVILGNGLAGVADGMGGHKGGEIASAGLRESLLRETRDRKADRDTLRNAVKTANHDIWEQQEADASLTGMGTTLTVVWPTPDEMIIGQVGDSRAYLLRDGELTQVTEDHSMVADMVRKGVLTEEQAACHPMRNYITRAVGTEEDVEIDLSMHDRKHGDRWLICSDGMYGMVTKGEMLQLMQTENLEEAAEKMLQAALAGGGRDNISLVLLQDDTVFPEHPEISENEDGSKPENSSDTEEVTPQ